MYSDDDLREYFERPENRKVRRGAERGGADGADGDEKGGKGGQPRTPIGRFWHAKFAPNADMARAATAVTYVAATAILGVLVLGLYFWTLLDELPPMREIENPDFQLATVAYTADGEMLMRYAYQNRSWVNYEDISPHVINALWATEDHRFYAHWGIDMTGMLSIPLSILKGDPRGASTISQQLARNLYNARIGRDVTVSRKLKEMVTAVQLERRYTKPEIMEMYLNTVEFGNGAGGNALYGIDSAARVYFGKAPIDLDILESATLVGMLQATSAYNPIRNPVRSQQRRNIVLTQMTRRGVLPDGFLAENREVPVETDYRSDAITQSIAPYFAEHVRNELEDWGERMGYDIYEDGLVVYTTLDSRLQKMAVAAVDSVTTCLQKVVDFEWSPEGGPNRVWSANMCDYMRFEDDSWSALYNQQPNLLNNLIVDTDRYQSMRRSGIPREAVFDSLRANTAYIDSLKQAKQRIEAGFVALDPQTGYVKAWVGGREITRDWYDHVSIARRQAGSTFKPFVYTAAIDNGWSPYYTLLDDSVKYVDPQSGVMWNPTNFEEITGAPMTLRQALASSVNTVTAKLMLEVGPPEVAFYAKRMGIESPLQEVPSLALGTSDVTLLEMTKAYSTFANGGLLYEPTSITRIEDRSGNVLYEAQSAPKEALSETTAYTMVDMLRAVIRQGSGIRMVAGEYQLGAYDLGGKTGTTQNAADTWFMMIHPDLVMGAWVGFNDMRFRFRAKHYGQGGRTALHVVGRFFRSAANAEEAFVSANSRFPAPGLFGASPYAAPDSLRREEDDAAPRRGRVNW
jgi:penicillin-binding protein 1A